MTKKTYSEKLRDPRWQRKRLEILNRDKFTCQECDEVENELHVHHTYYEYGREIWDYEDKSLITFCIDCHSTITSRKKFAKDLIDEYFIYWESVDQLATLLYITSNYTPDKMDQVIKYAESLRK